MVNITKLCIARTVENLYESFGGMKSHDGVFDVAAKWKCSQRSHMYRFICLYANMCVYKCAWLCALTNGNQD